MKANINIMRDRKKVLKFVYNQSAVIGNAIPAGGMIREPELGTSINPNNVDGDFFASREG